MIESFTFHIVTASHYHDYTSQLKKLLIIIIFRLNYDNVKASLLHTRTLDPVEEGCAVDIGYFDNGKINF